MSAPDTTGKVIDLMQALKDSITPVPDDAIVAAVRRVSAERAVNVAAMLAQDARPDDDATGAAFALDDPTPRVLADGDLTDRLCGYVGCQQDAQTGLADKRGKWHYRCAEHYAGTPDDTDDPYASLYRPRFEVAYVSAAPSAIPSLADALATEQDARDDYVNMLEHAYRAGAAWAATDNDSSRVRYAATLRLMETMRLSSAAADKIATQDPGYAAHRDMLTRLSSAKLAAEADRDTAHTRLISARLVVEAALLRERQTTGGR